MAVKYWPAGGQRIYGPMVLLDGVTEGESDVIVVNGNADRLGGYVSFDAGVTAGEIEIRSAETPDYAGVWAVEATLPFKAGECYRWGLTGWIGCFKAVVSTAIAGGNARAVAGGRP